MIPSVGGFGAGGTNDIVWIAAFIILLAVGVRCLFCMNPVINIPI